LTGSKAILELELAAKVLSLPFAVVAFDMVLKYHILY
jgi:hypothetical protein